MPKRYRDILPEPPRALPPAPSQLTLASEAPQAQAQVMQDFSSTLLPPFTLPLTPLSQAKKILKSPRNIFGLFRQYCAARFPAHDPCENAVSDDLMNASPDISSALPLNPHYPYPNESSFLLGEWYWNGGEKKSQSTFENLIKIVGHPTFRPEDVASSNWRLIDAHLAGGDHQHHAFNGKDDCEDEQAGGDWVKTPIKIQVPFHKGMLHPGQREFDAGVLHHRKLVSALKEKITRPSVHPHLHFEPYEYFWQPNEATEPIRVHGELYTSEAFIEAHRTLQDSPGEPGCDFPRVVLALMFASDSTQLTSFSNAKLWPVYLVVGNESKDRRSKPTCRAIEHIAYLETVRKDS